MKLLNDDGVELDALFSVEPTVHGFDILFESRGGSDHGPRQSRNKDYAPALLLLLTRMGKHDLVVQDIQIASSRTDSLPPDQRRLLLSSHPYPIRLSELDSTNPLRLELGRASAAFGRAAQKTSGGNPTKRLRLSIGGRGLKEMTVETFGELLTQPFPTKRTDRRHKFEPLGEYLQTQSTSEVRLSIEEISTLLGPLGKTAATHQLWANAKDHHLSRRKHWFDAGFKAFYEPANNSVRFVRERGRPFISPSEVWTEPRTADPEKLAASVNNLRAMQIHNPHLATPPNGSPGGVQAIGQTTRFIRDPNVIFWVLETAKGRCEVCDARAPFDRIDGSPYLEIHHMRPLGEGGPDVVANAIAACPNCHRRLHHGDDRRELRAKTINKIVRLIDYPTAPVTTLPKL